MNILILFVCKIVYLMQKLEFGKQLMSFKLSNYGSLFTNAYYLAMILH